MAGPSVMQREARSSTCGHAHTHINTHHLGRRSSQNKLNTQNPQQQNTQDGHKHRSSTARVL